MTVERGRRPAPPPVVGSFRAPQSLKNKTQCLILTTNLIPRGVHVLNLSGKICSHREHHRTRSWSEVYKVPVSCRVLDPTKSHVPRSLESQEVPNPTKSWILRSPWSCEALVLVRDAGSCGLVPRGSGLCTSGVQSLYSGGPVSVHRGFNLHVPGGDPLFSGL